MGKKKGKWKTVTFAWQFPKCPDCLEPWCPKHKTHWADCPCIGMEEEDVEYEWHGKMLWGRRIVSKG